MTIVKCTCPHEGQDKLHGRGKRVANWSEKKLSFGCTVCGKRHGKK